MMFEAPTSLRIDEPGVRALFTEAARFQSWLDVAAALRELTIIPAEMSDSEHPRNANWPMFSPIVHFRFGA